MVEDSAELVGGEGANGGRLGRPRLGCRVVDVHGRGRALVTVDDVDGVHVLREVACRVITVKRTTRR